MPSYVIFDVDISAPEVSFGEPEITPDRELIVPYTIDEPIKDITAVLNYAQGEIEVTIYPDYFSMPIPLGLSNAMLMVAVTDVVDNLAVRHSHLVFWGGHTELFEVELMASPRLTTTLAADPQLEVVVFSSPQLQVEVTPQ